MESEGEKLKKVQLTFSFFFSYIRGIYLFIEEKNRMRGEENLEVLVLMFQWRLFWMAWGSFQSSPGKFIFFFK